MNEELFLRLSIQLNVFGAISTEEKHKFINKGTEVTSRIVSIKGIIHSKGGERVAKFTNESPQYVETQ